MRHVFLVTQIEILNSARYVVLMGLDCPRILVDCQRDAVAGLFEAEAETPASCEEVNGQRLLLAEGPAPPVTWRGTRMGRQPQRLGADQFDLGASGLRPSAASVRNRALRGGDRLYRVTKWRIRRQRWRGLAVMAKWGRAVAVRHTDNVDGTSWTPLFAGDHRRRSQKETDCPTRTAGTPRRPCRPSPTCRMSTPSLPPGSRIGRIVTRNRLLQRPASVRAPIAT